MRLSKVRLGFRTCTCHWDSEGKMSQVRPRIEGEREDSEGDREIGKG